MESSTYKFWLSKYDALPRGTQQLIAESVLQKSLELYLNPTEKCNFRCTYCYEDFALGRMQPVVIRRVKKFIIRQLKGRTRLYLNWFGGEPLLAAQVIYDLAGWAKRYCKRQGISCTGAMTTNGYLLTVEVIRKLVEVNMTYFQITLDGYGSAHDAMRKRADGRGTFDTLWANLIQARDTSLAFRILLRVHVRRDGFDIAKELLERIDHTFGSDTRFQIGLHPLEDLGGPQSGLVPSIDHATFEEWSLLLQARDGKRSSVTDMRKDMVVAPGQDACGTSVCYACKNNSFHVRSDGRVGKCTVALDKDYNLIGTLDDRGCLDVDSRKLAKWTRGLITLNEQDLGCPFSKGDAYFEDTIG